MKILGGNPRRPRRGGRRNRLPPSSHRSFESGTDIGTSPRIQDTGYDAAIARKLLDEERLALKSSNHERSSHQRNPPLAPPFVPDTSADSELAGDLRRKVAQGPSRSVHRPMSMERSGHQRFCSSTWTQAGWHGTIYRHQRSTAPPGPKHDGLERSSHQRSAAPSGPQTRWHANDQVIERSPVLAPKHDGMERSSHQRSAAPAWTQT
jgi:hypothetical protein